MILQIEIIETSKTNGVPTTTIDRDWVLGHFLNAMFNFRPVKELFIFKGGTCIKKCYVEDYRFSEDLDFTLRDNNFLIDENFIKEIIKEAKKISGVDFYLFSFRKQIFENIDQGYECILKFWGANHKRNQKPLPANRWLDKFKLDIVFSEKLFDQCQSKNILHPYSDHELITNQVNTYSYNEIVAEKLRSLIQRNRPRDIYDNWYFAKHTIEDEYKNIKELLIKKAEFKKIKISGVEQFVNSDKKHINKNEWNSSLQHQISHEKLPDFEIAYTTVEKFITNILNS